VLFGSWVSFVDLAFELRMNRRERNETEGDRSHLGSVCLRDGDSDIN